MKKFSNHIIEQQQPILTYYSRSLIWVNSISNKWFVISWALLLILSLAMILTSSSSILVVLSIHVLIFLLDEVVRLHVSHLLHPLLPILIVLIILIVVKVIIVELVLYFSFSNLLLSLSSFNLSLFQLLGLSLSVSFSLNLFLSLLFHFLFRFLFTSSYLVLHTLLFLFFLLSPS